MRLVEIEKPILQIKLENRHWILERGCDVIGVSLLPVVDFTNILQAAFAPIFFVKKLQT